MRRRSRPLARCLVIVLLALGPAVAPPHPAAAAARDGCPVGGVEVDLAGSADTAVVSGHAAAACQAAGSRPAGGGGPRTYWTYEIACSPDRVRASEGLCSRTPCPNGRFFAFRTLHRADGGTEPAGYSCVSLERARVRSTLTAADVFAAIRRVRLPTGAIRITPSVRGLANLPSRLWLVGDARPPVNLLLAGSTVHAEFQPVRYRWTIGPDGAGPWTVPAGADSSGRDGEAAMAFPRGGEFVVSVVTTWSATAFLDGRYVGQVEGLASTARIAYPVAELRTALSG